MKDFLHPFCAGSRTGSVQGTRPLPQAVSWNGPDGIPSSETYTITYTCTRPALPLGIPAHRAEGPVQSPTQWPDKHSVDAGRDRSAQSDVARQIAALRGAGQTWAEVAGAVGLSSSRVRALYAERAVARSR